MIRKAEFTSVWDDGKTKVTTSCEVDLKTREIVAIEKKSRCEKFGLPVYYD